MAVAAVSEVVSAFGFLEVVEEFTAAPPERFDRSFSRGPQEAFDFRKHLIDGIEVGTVGRQKEELGLRRLDRFFHSRDTMFVEVVHHHQFAGFRCWRKVLFDIATKDLTIHHERRGQPTRGFS